MVVADVLLCWLVPKPAGAPEPEAAQVLGLGDTVELKRRVAEQAQQTISAPLFVTLDGATWGLAGTYRCAEGLSLFQGLCQLGGLREGKDFARLGSSEALAGGELVLLKQEFFTVFLCRAWARGRAYEAVRPLLAEAGGCPFNEKQAELQLDSGEEIATHYLELLLGRGCKESCPKAEKYLQGVARDLTLDQQPYLSSVLGGLAMVKSGDSVLSILTEPRGAGAEIPRDYQEDLALAVAAKALELVEVLGMDL